MNYAHSKTINGTFDSVKEKVTEELKKDGFGVLSEIDVKDTLKKKIDVDFKKYTILGACNPHYAHQALTSEEKIGVMLPCNVIIVEKGDNEYEVSAVSPKASMMAIENDSLAEIAETVEDLLKKVIDRLN